MADGDEQVADAAAVAPIEPVPAPAETPAPLGAPVGGVIVRYTGDGRWIPGVPAEDHVVETAADAAALVATGMYEIGA